MDTVERTNYCQRTNDAKEVKAIIFSLSCPFTEDNRNHHQYHMQSWLLEACNMMTHVQC